MYPLQCIVGPISVRINVPPMVNGYIHASPLLPSVCRYGPHYNVYLEMMSVSQEVKGFMKELYFMILSRRKTSFHAKLFNVHMF